MVIPGDRGRWEYWDADWDLGNARIQAPADGVNVLGVGACDSMGEAWQRASYSSIGPGRSPGIVKPEIVVFGSCDSAPFLVPVCGEAGIRAWNPRHELRLAAGLTRGDRRPCVSRIGHCAARAEGAC